MLTICAEGGFHTRSLQKVNTPSTIAYTTNKETDMHLRPQCTCNGVQTIKLLL